MAHQHQPGKAPPLWKMKVGQMRQISLFPGHILYLAAAPELIQIHMAKSDQQKTIQDFLAGKSSATVLLFDALVAAFQSAGPITLHPAKTMIGISNGDRRVAWVTQLGKNFVHVVFPFREPHPDNLCFQKIAQVPGDAYQFNHHFRMYHADDLNEEVLKFIRMAYAG